MRRGFAVFAFLLLAGAVWLFLDRSVFVVRDVEIACDDAVDEADVTRISGVELGSRLRALDEALISREIESTGAYQFISVERFYPSTVRISIRRRVPAAMAEAGGIVLLMDADGYVISTSPEAPDADAVYVTGLDIGAYDIGRRISADEDRIYAMGEVIRVLDVAEARAYVSELNVSDVNDLYIYSRTGIFVMLGDVEEMQSKVGLMKGVLADLESRGETSGRLDVSSGDKADFDGS